jgi:diadenosine tetraphosphate (Ap4A) HIT family hydrolase/5-methylcytosine-specific restriction endonuclease McrA
MAGSGLSLRPDLKEFKMNFLQLEDFIKSRMRMSHVYQPVMLMALLQGGGKASTTKIAKAILDHDESQIEYYEKIVGNMVGRVLRSHGLVKKVNSDYFLSLDEKLSDRETSHLLELCREKLIEYEAKRGEQIWQHRKLSSGYISGTLKFEVLKDAEFHCELCGISADVRALEVDHIVPRNLGGADDLSNLQALCYSCNSMKRDRDETDFRKVRESFSRKIDGCPFCNLIEKRVVCENELAFAIRDKFPVTPLHTLVIPKRHVSEIFDLSRPETNACNELLGMAKQGINVADADVRGFNVGINNGEAAGQTVQHCHIHLIPRRQGDIPNPVGGIRNVIPGKGQH